MNKNKKSVNFITVLFKHLFVVKGLTSVTDEILFLRNNVIESKAIHVIYNILIEWNNTI